MAIKGVALTVVYYAWDAANNTFLTGDVANHTMRVVTDGTATAADNAPAEVENGAYKLLVSAAEMGGDFITVEGSSSTADIEIIPVSVATEQGVLATVAKTGADSDTLETLSGQVDGASTHTAANVWTAGTRTLTSYGTLVADVAAAVWEIATSGLTTVGSIGKLLVDNINATISSRAPEAGGNVAAILADTGTDGVAVADKTGYSLSVAGIQAIWDKATSALTTVGSIGKLLVDNVNATISSRSSHTAANVWAAGTRTLTSYGTLVADTAAAVWEIATASLTTVGTIGKLLVDNINATISSRGTADPGDQMDLQDAPNPTAITAIQADLAVEATLEAIQGAGWSDETLVAVKAVLDIAAGDVVNIDGEAMRGTDSAALASAWTAARAGYQDELAAANLPADIARILGLTQENFYLDTVVADGNGRMTSARMRTYSVAGSVGTAGDVLATYTVTATYTGSETAPTTYKVVKA